MHAAGWLVAALQVASAADLTPETLLLARIKARTSENLTRQPNYTCLQTTERSRRRAPSRKFELVDTLRLEVALVGGKELFAWPGAGRFEERRITEMVGGTIGDGSFALHARSVFLSNAPTYTHAGRRVRDGRQTERYDYRVPQMLSGYKLRVLNREAVVGYHGSFWVDAATLDLLRLEVIADDIPPHLEIDSAASAMEYARVEIGEADFLLPASAELMLTDLAGGENRNLTHFTACRQYAGESVLSFADPPPTLEPAPTQSPAEPIRLPAGLSLELRLESAIDLRKAAVGDPIAAAVCDDVKRKSQTLVPKGARVTGRIVRLEKSGGFYMIAFLVSAIEFDNRRGGLTASLIGAATLGRSSFPGFRDGGALPSTRRPAVLNVGPGAFVAPAGLVSLPKGFRTSWRTESPIDNGEHR